MRTCGLNGLALTKLHILDVLDAIEVCTGYRLDGKEIDHLPAGEGALPARGPVALVTTDLGKEPTANARFLGEFAGPGHWAMSAGARNWWAVHPALLSTSPNGEDHYSGPERPPRLNEMSRGARIAGVEMADYYPLIARAIAGLDPRCLRRRPPCAL